MKVKENWNALPDIVILSLVINSYNGGVYVLFEGNTIYGRKTYHDVKIRFTTKYFTTEWQKLENGNIAGCHTQRHPILNSYVLTGRLC